MNEHVKSMWVRVYFFIFVFSCWGASAANSLGSRGSSSSSSSFERPLVTISQMQDVSVEQAKKIAQELEQQVDSQPRAVLAKASDHPEILFSNTSESQTDLKIQHRQKILLPLGRLAELKDHFKSEYDAHTARVRETLRNDKMTVLIVTITTSVDSLVWLQATTFDHPQKLSMLSLNLLFAVTFGLDRELWGKLTSPIRDRWQNAMRVGRFGEIVSQVGSNFILGSMVYFTRDILLNFQDLVTHYSQADTWLQWLKVSSVLAGTHFAWSEIFTKTSAEQNPVAKLNLKRLTDLRYLILVSFASTSMVFQPEVYGVAPIVVLTAHGVLGISMLLNYEKVINWLEQNHASQAIYKQFSRFENWLTTLNQNSRKAEYPIQPVLVPNSFSRLSCTSLF